MPGLTVRPKHLGARRGKVVLRNPKAKFRSKDEGIGAARRAKLEPVFLKPNNSCPLLCIDSKFYIVEHRIAFPYLP